MIQLFYSKAQNSVTEEDPFQSRLARQMTAWVFLGIVAIEIIIFIPSYGRRRTEELRKLEAVSQEVLSTVKLSVISNMPERSILKNIQLRDNPIIKGLALYNAKGELINLCCCCAMISRRQERRSRLAKPLFSRVSSALATMK